MIMIILKISMRAKLVPLILLFNIFLPALDDLLMIIHPLLIKLKIL